MTSGPLATELPQCPDYIKTDAGRTEWRRAGQQLIADGRLYEIQLSALTLYCAFYGRVVEQRRAAWCQ